MQEQELIASMREFNRFYARILGVFDKYALGTDYTLAQARILMEIGRQPGCSANSIAVYLDMDRSYVARLLKGFEKNGLLQRLASQADSRKKCLWLTTNGEAVYHALEKKSDERVRLPLEHIPVRERERLVRAVTELSRILDRNGTDDGVSGKQ